MKKMFIVAALVAATTTPALACHHFRVWRYPWPQRCVVRHAYRGPEYFNLIDPRRPPARIRPVRDASVPPEAERPPALAPVQPDPGPPLTKEEEQAVSVEQLRKALERAHGEPLELAAPASGSNTPGTSSPAEAQAKSSSTPQRAPAGPPVNDVPVNPLD